MRKLDDRVARPKVRDADYCVYCASSLHEQRGWVPKLYDVSSGVYYDVPRGVANQIKRAMHFSGPVNPLIDARRRVYATCKRAV